MTTTPVPRAAAPPAAQWTPIVSTVGCNAGCPGLPGARFATAAATVGVPGKSDAKAAADFENGANGCPGESTARPRRRSKIAGSGGIRPGTRLGTARGLIKYRGRQIQRWLQPRTGVTIELGKLKWLRRFARINSSYLVQSSGRLGL